MDIWLKFTVGIFAFNLVFWYIYKTNSNRLRLLCLWFADINHCVLFPSALLATETHSPSVNGLGARETQAVILASLWILVGRLQ